MAPLITPDSVSMDRAKLGRVEELFREQIDEGLHPGAGLAVYRYGQLVLDIKGGLADADVGQAVSDDTLFVLMSSTKAIAACCLYILKDRGRLAWDDPVSKHWPEFGKHGKQRVTINHVLTHRSGIPETPKNLPLSDWIDWGKVVSSMEDAVPTFTPGEALVYHPVNYGWVIGELVHRIDGRPFNQFLSQEITEPLGMADTYVGLPAHMESRVAKIHLMGEESDPNGVVLRYNRPEVHRSIVPAACGIASALDLAKFYAMMERGGILDGVRILGQDIVNEVTSLQVRDIEVASGLLVQRSLGLVLADERMGLSKDNPTNTFGHGGLGTSLGWADRESGLAVGYITNGCQDRDANNGRLSAMSQAIRAACD